MQDTRLPSFSCLLSQLAAKPSDEIGTLEVTVPNNVQRVQNNQHQFYKYNVFDVLVTNIPNTHLHKDIYLQFYLDQCADTNSDPAELCKGQGSSPLLFNKATNTKIRFAMQRLVKHQRRVLCQMVVTIDGFPIPLPSCHIQLYSRFLHDTNKDHIKYRYLLCFDGQIGTYSVQLQDSSLIQTFPVAKSTPPIYTPIPNPLPIVTPTTVKSDKLSNSGSVTLSTDQYSQMMRSFALLQNQIAALKTSQQRFTEENMKTQVSL